MTLKIVAIGGGHGLSATLQSLVLLDADLTAIVSVADDGGSSGRLRHEFDVLPPGDLRMAISALSPDSTVRRLWNHRYGGDGHMAGHSLGNLILTAAWQQSGVIPGLAAVTMMMGAKGVILPVSLEPHHLVAEVEAASGDRETLRGQAAISRVSRAVQLLATSPESVPACTEALAAIREADIVILGPGSWFTSVIAPLLVHGIAETIIESTARVALVSNLGPAFGHATSSESAGFGVDDYLVSLRELVGIVPDIVFVDERESESSNLRERFAEREISIDVSSLRLAGTGIHDPEMLAPRLRGWLSSRGA